jgi:hypothetical protein
MLLASNLHLVGARGNSDTVRLHCGALSAEHDSKLGK